MRERSSRLPTAELHAPPGVQAGIPLNAPLLGQRSMQSSPRLRGREVGDVEMVLLDALAPSGRLASSSDSFEIARV